MERADRLGRRSTSSIAAFRREKTYMTLDASNEEFIGICFRILDEVRRGLFSGDGNERDTFISRFEPDDLRAFNGPTARFLGAITLSLASFGFLLFLGSGRRWSK